MSRPLGVILAGGAGTRLRPLTPHTPKFLVALAGRPLLAYAVETLRALGVEDVAVIVDASVTGAVGRAGFALREFVQLRPLGAGDALLAAGEALDGRVVVVHAVDAVIRGDPRPALDAFVASDAMAGILVTPVDDPAAYGVAVLEGDRVTALEEKPARPRSNLALCGPWFLRPAAVERLRTRPVINARGECDLTATLGAMVEEGADVRGYRLPGAWLDAGTIAGLLRAQAVLLAGVEAHVDARAVVIDSTVEAGSVVAEGARVERSIVRASSIGAGAVVEDARLDGAIVEAGAVVRGGVYREVVISARGEVAGPGAGPGGARTA